MPRWYLGFRCRAKNRQLKVNRFTDQVQHYDLGNHIPVMRVEKGQKHGEFYIFLAIESQRTGEVPVEVQHVLPLLSSLGSPIQKPDSSIFEMFTLEQIRNMVGVEHTVRDYARLIPYMPRKILELSDPFVHQERANSDEDAPVEDMLLRSRNFDRLLRWLSAAGSGSWQTFQNVCHTLGLKRRHDAPAHVLRRLRILGHMETTPDRTRWSTTPTVLVQSGDESFFFLCGQRDNVMLQTLRNMAHIEELPQPHGVAPALVLVRAFDGDNLVTQIKKTQYEIQFAGNAALRLAQILPSLAEWKHTLEILPYFSPYQYRVKRFFDADFIEVDFDRSASGFYQFWPLKSTQSDRPDCTLFYDAEHEQFLRGDWYGLRFLARQTNSVPCPVAYDALSGRLAIKWGWRWPELYERVLVLASGKLPIYHNRWLVYESITPQILAELIPKLNLECEETIKSCMM